MTLLDALSVDGVLFQSDEKGNKEPEDNDDWDSLSISERRFLCHILCDGEMKDVSTYYLLE